MRVRVYPYSSRSVSARSVARELGGLVLKREGSQYRYRSGDVIINWGASAIPSGLPVTLNYPDAVRKAVSKHKTYQALNMAEVPTVEWTTSAALVSEWINSGSVVFHRAVDHGARGVGITVITDASDTIPEGGYFTKKIRGREFRVYQVGNVTTSILEKRRRNGVDAHPHIKSHGNGYVFCREYRAPIPREHIQETCCEALKALRLDFAGLDVILTRDNKVHVLEINSAPGITGTALGEFCSAIQNLEL